MILTIMRLTGLSRGLSIALAAVAAAGALWLAIHLYNGWVEDRYEAKVQAQLAKDVVAGAEAAASASAETKNEVETTNDEARKAAIGSDDPLRAGLNSIRSTGGRN
jgi:hypothetical protein